MHRAECPPMETAMSDFSCTRRAALVAAALSFGGTAAFAQANRKVSALFAGKIDDGGFMQAGYEGLMAAQKAAGVETAFTQGIVPKKELLIEALRALAATGPAGVIAHGGQNNEATRAVASEFPNIRFAVTQGNVTGPNLASYEVMQEHSAFLAGMFAAMTSKSGVIGHMSGIRVTPGLKGRAGYVSGARHAKPGIKILTNFSGNQDDNALSKKVALAMIGQGADVIFTMLNAGRMGAVEACREKGAKQIGNVGDWVKRMPDVFVASAFADVGRAVQNAAQDIASGAFKAGTIQHIGAENPEAVRLIMADSTPRSVQDAILAAAKAIASGALKVSTEYTGEEFANPA